MKNLLLSEVKKPFKNSIGLSEKCIVTKLKTGLFLAHEMFFGDTWFLQDSDDLQTPSQKKSAEINDNLKTKHSLNPNIKRDKA